MTKYLQLQQQQHEPPPPPSSPQQPSLLLLCKKRHNRHDSNSVNTTTNNNNNNNTYVTKFAMILSIITLILLCILSMMYNNNIINITGSHDDNNDVIISHHTLYHHHHHHHRQLEEDNSSLDYSKVSCNYIYEQTPDTGSPQQCAFARTCNQNTGVWAPFLFCLSNNTNQKKLFYTILLSPIILVWLLLLFRLLGSTAEDYFSPALEMFAIKLGLPPRFAGVTLLALGNGAADVSATIASMLNDEKEGYKLSLGALSGAAMMISTVISACVILTAQGVPCRGALVRDVMALIITVITVYIQLLSNQIGPESITLFLSLYVIFVILVLVADIYHRAIVLPRLANLASNIEIQRQQQIHYDLSTTTNTTNINNTNNDTLSPPSIPNDLSSSRQQQHPNNNTTIQQQQPVLGTILSALSNYDTTPTIQDDMGAGTGGGWGIESDQFTSVTNRPTQLLRGQHGILSHANTTTKTMPSSSNQHHQHRTQLDFANQSPSSIEQDPDNSYTILQETDMMDNICIQPGSRSTINPTVIPIPIDSWYEAIDDAIYEIRQHFHVLIYDNIINDEDMYIIHKLFLICELPFTIARQLTVPIPCEGYYCRGLVGLSLILSPIWFLFYLWHGHETNILGTSLTKWMIFAIFELCVIMFALCIVRYAPRGGPNGNGEMSLVFATPIALYGFVMAATWIDTIADALVSLLNFIGIILRIPGPVIGLTILAWGNSMGDLSANMTMARKGLANMAMTACFAGPVFNILVGLGLGFSSLAAQTGNITTEVTLSPSVVTGFIFIAINGISLLTIGLGFGKGRIPKQFGYLALLIYSIYLIVSISLQYSKSSE